MPKVAKSFLNTLKTLASARGVRGSEKFYKGMSKYLSGDLANKKVWDLARETGARKYDTNVFSRFLPHLKEGQGPSFMSDMVSGVTISKSTDAGKRLISAGVAEDLDMYYGGVRSLLGAKMVPEGMSRWDIKRHARDAQKLTIFHEAAEKTAIKTLNVGSLVGKPHADPEVMYSELAALKGIGNQRLWDDITALRIEELSKSGTGKAYKRIVEQGMEYGIEIPVLNAAKNPINGMANGATHEILKVHSDFGSRWLGLPSKSMRLAKRVAKKGVVSTMLAGTLAATPTSVALAGEAISTTINVTSKYSKFLSAIDDVVNITDKTAAVRAKARNLLVRTGIHESGGLRYTTQIGGGPARGYFQIEYETAKDVVQRYAARADKKQYMDMLEKFSGMSRSELLGLDKAGLNALVESNTRVGATIARLKYKMVPESIPGGLDAQATYWSKYYQTSESAVKKSQFMKSNTSYELEIPKANKTYEKIVGHHPGWANKKTEANIGSTFVAGESISRIYLDELGYNIAAAWGSNQQVDKTLKAFEFQYGSKWSKEHALNFLDNYSKSTNKAHRRAVQSIIPQMIAKLKAGDDFTVLHKDALTRRVGKLKEYLTKKNTDKIIRGIDLTGSTLLHEDFHIILKKVMPNDEARFGYLTNALEKAAKASGNPNKYVRIMERVEGIYDFFDVPEEVVIRRLTESKIRKSGIDIELVNEIRKNKHFKNILSLDEKNPISLSKVQKLIGVDNMAEAIEIKKQKKAFLSKEYSDVLPEPPERMSHKISSKEISNVIKNQDMNKIQSKISNTAKKANSTVNKSIAKARQLSSRSAKKMVKKIITRGR